MLQRYRCSTSMTWRSLVDLDKEGYLIACLLIDWPERLADADANVGYITGSSICIVFQV